MNDLEQAPRNARAAAPARPSIRAVAIRVVPGDRTPRVVVEMQLPGGIVAGFTIARRRRGSIVFAPPQAADGGAGVVLPDEIAEEVEAAALDAAKRDAAMWRHLTLPMGLRS